MRVRAQLGSFIVSHFHISYLLTTEVSESSITSSMTCLHENQSLQLHGYEPWGSSQACKTVNFLLGDTNNFIANKGGTEIYDVALKQSNAL